MSSSVKQSQHRLNKCVKFAILKICVFNRKQNLVCELKGDPKQTITNC